MPKFQFLKRLRTGPNGENILRLTWCRGNHLEPNEICFSFSVEKVFHLLKAKLFLTWIIVGRFYRERLFIAILRLVKHNY